MHKLILAFCLTIISGVAAFGQASGDYKKTEFYVGYSNNQVDTAGNGGAQNFFGDRTSFHGFEVSGVINTSRYIGIKGDVSGAYRNRDFNFPAASIVPSFKTKNSLYNFLGGVQFKDNASERKVKPFAHVLGGVGHARTKIDDNCPSGAACIAVSTTESETGLAGAFGGGLDIKLSDRVDFRLIQVDYNPVRLDGSTTHNVRFGVGFNFK